jgi:hypothetical protein
VGLFLEDRPDSDGKGNVSEHIFKGLLQALLVILTDVIFSHYQSSHGIGHLRNKPKVFRVAGNERLNLDPQQGNFAIKATSVAWIKFNRSSSVSIGE